MVAFLLTILVVKVEISGAGQAGESYHIWCLSSLKSSDYQITAAAPSPKVEKVVKSHP